MALFDDVKVALRISHTLLDHEITETMEAARLEMIRSGMSPDKAYADEPLVNKAIKTYCQFSFSSDKNMADGYFESWKYQLDNLRKSKGYGLNV